MSRKEQIEKQFMRRALRELKKADCPINEKGRVIIQETLRSAAMVGACEERARTLELVRGLSNGRMIAEAITRNGVLSVLGYEED